MTLLFGSLSFNPGLKYILGSFRAQGNVLLVWGITTT